MTVLNVKILFKGSHARFLV